MASPVPEAQNSGVLQPSGSVIAGCVSPLRQSCLYGCGAERRVDATSSAARREPLRSGE